MTLSATQSHAEQLTLTDVPTDPPTAVLARQDNARDRLDALAGTRANADLPHSCRCGLRWSGSLTSHCGACHTTFTGVSTFDQHRVNGQCSEPERVGLAMVGGRAYDCWGNATDEAQR